ncbi:MAG: glutathione S-transferase [Hyphomonadaceae bacterium]|nr:glutathione S-transferase [Hyphomonadaceae bacterium]
MGHVLYSFRRCPFAMRARMALKISGADYKHREILLRDKPASMLAASPKGTVPVFIIDDEKVIDESYDLMLWALKKNDPENWLAPGLAQMQPIIEMITGEFKHHLDRYKYASRYSDDADRFSVDHSHRDEAVKILAEFETRLEKSEFLIGDVPSLADFATFPFIRQFSNVEPEWWNKPQFPRLHAWLDGLVNGELFKSIMKKHPLWVDP